MGFMAQLTARIVSTPEVLAASPPPRGTLLVAAVWKAFGGREQRLKSIAAAQRQCASQSEPRMRPAAAVSVWGVSRRSACEESVHELVRRRRHRRWGRAGCWRARVLLRSPQPLAAQLEREHQRSAPPG